ISYDVKEKLIDFLNSENELIRSKRAYYRARLQLSSSMTLLSKQVADKPDSSYAVDYYLKRMRELRAETKEHAEAVVKSSDDFTVVYANMDRKETALSADLNREGIRFVRVFEKYRESNSNSIDETKRAAQAIAQQLAA